MMAVLTSVGCSLAIPVVADDQPPNQNASPLVIWDNRSAKDWVDSYPVGNGRLGAMPQGTFPNEKILINEETIWAREGGYRMPENSHEYLEKVRELEAAGMYREADLYFQKHLQNGKKPCSFQLFGWLQLDYSDIASMKTLRRDLDLRTGIARNVYSLDDGNEITQDIFVSSPDDVIAIEIKATAKFSLSVSLENATIEGNDLVLHGAASGENATQFTGRVRINSANKIEASGNTLKIQDVAHASIYVSVATNFDRTDSGATLPGGWQNKTKSDLDYLRAKSPTVVRNAAVSDHQRYFDRMDVDFGPSSDAIQAMTTRERLKRIKQGKDDDPDLVELYFQYGRYLLVASSRPGCFPANLQGVWNPHLKAPWGSDYHLNINVQMNYWPAETTNLAETHQPLIDLIRFYQPKGKEMARRLGMPGWCMGHSTDIWGNAQIMSKTAFWGGSFFGGQWLTLHILEHYRFNRDKEFLLENWDVLTASVQFVDAWLIPGPTDGQLMSRPSCSPENSFRYNDESGKIAKAALSAGNSFDQFMILQVLNDYVEAAEALGKLDDPFVKKIQDAIPKVYRPQIADDGRLMEWRLPFDEPEPGHRHISHVIGAYPGNQISLDRDPAMRDAVIKTLDGRMKRGGAGTGWSRAWTIGMYARLSDSKLAYQNLIAILRKSTHDNLWDRHPPFQIDGNFGSTAAIAEMLLHSHEDELKLLPALPSKWRDGRVSGLRARGDYTVDILWENSVLESAVIHGGANADGDKIPVTYEGETQRISVAPGASVEVSFAKQSAK